MVNWFIRYFSQINVTPPLYMLSGFRFLSRLQFFEANHKFQLLFRLMETSRIPNAVVQETKNKTTDLEILFVCSGKDLVILPAAISAAISATTAHEISKISIVVPTSIIHEVESVCGHIDLSFEVISEETLISSHIFNKLKESFYARAGWVYQQLLKIEYVSNSNASGVLVCDADTLLIQPRLWLNSDGQQILTPTWEWHPPYYEFLSRFDLTQIKPIYTFVPHHMLMQPSFMVEARKLLQWRNIEETVDYLIANRKEKDLSPFSIDYELYAQYLYKFHQDKIILSKWANVALNRDEKNMTVELYAKYNSISFHDHLVS